MVAKQPAEEAISIQESWQQWSRSTNSATECKHSKTLCSTPSCQWRNQALRGAFQEHVLDDMENYVRTLVDGPPIKASGLKYSMSPELCELTREGIKTAMNLSKGTPNTDAWWKSVLESKAIQEIGPFVDSKQYRQWNKKMKNALEQVRPNARHALDAIE